MKPDSLDTFLIETQTSNFITIRPVRAHLLQASGRAGTRTEMKELTVPKLRRDYKGASHKDINEDASH